MKISILILAILLFSSEVTNSTVPNWEPVYVPNYALLHEEIMVHWCTRCGNDWELSNQISGRLLAVRRNPVAAARAHPRGLRPIKRMMTKDHKLVEIFTTAVKGQYCYKRLQQ